jgi:hypothetical protein
MRFSTLCVLHTYLERDYTYLSHIPARLQGRDEPDGEILRGMPC